MGAALDPSGPSPGSRRPPGSAPLWRRPAAWAIASLVFNPLLLVSAVALLLGALAVRARRRAGESAQDEWLGVALAFGGVLSGLAVHAVLGGLGFAVHAGWSRAQLEHGPIGLAGYSYREARAAHRTRLTRHGPAPDQASVTPPPAYATEVTLAGATGPLEAWLLLPSGEAPVPGVLYLHSGFALAESDAANAWSFVTAGYAVLLPSLRGENGNPGDFELCLGEVDDLRTAVRHLAGHPRVLDDRIYVFGHALGGALATLLALDPGPSVRLTGSSGGLYAPNVLLAWATEGYVPFRPLAARERDLRTPVRFADQLLVPHYAYFGEDDPLRADLARMKPALDAGRNLHVETVPGDAERSLLPAIQRFIRRAADARDFDDARVLADLVAPEPVRREAALAALGRVRLPLTPAQTTRLLRLALELDRAGKPPEPRLAPERHPVGVGVTADALDLPVDPRPAALLDAAARSSSPEDLRRVDEAYAALTPVTRSAALRALLEPNDRAALVRGIARVVGERDPAVEFPARALHPIRAELIFPELLRLGSDHPWWPELLTFVVERCGDVRAVTAAGARGEALVLAHLSRLRARLDAVPHAPARRTALRLDLGGQIGLALDALGCFAEPSAARIAALRAQESQADAMLRLHAVQALLALEQPVSDATLAGLAADDETRAELFRILAPRGELARLPAATCTQEALARSHLVGWLAHPAELGEPPATIELFGRVHRAGGDYFVFRFRERSRGAWLAGVAGPYLPDTVTAEEPDDVFSEFRPASLATAEGHVESAVRLLTEWRGRAGP